MTPHHDRYVTGSEGETRYRRLGAALDELDVPVYPDGFLASVWARIDADEGGRKQPNRGRRLFGHRRVLAGFAAAAVAVAVAVAVVLLGVPGVRETSPPVATAAQVLAAMKTGMAAAHTFSGRFTQTDFETNIGTTVRQGSFAVTARGDSRTETTVVKDTSHGRLVGSGTTIAAYDARTRLVTIAAISPSGQQTYSAGSDPSQDVPNGGSPVTFLTAYRSAAATLRGLLAENMPGLGIRVVTYAGRPAWQVNVSLRQSSTVPPFTGTEEDRWQLIADQQTGFLLFFRYTEMVKGWMESHQFALRDVRVNVPLGRGLFTVARAPGATLVPLPVAPDTRGAASLGAVAHALGYPPLVPKRLPPGYHLESVTLFSAGSGKTGMLIGYRHSFDRFSVMEYNTGETPGGSSVDADAVWQKNTRLPSGALAGNVAQIALDFAQGPQLSVLTSHSLDVHVSGDLSPAELLEVANSLATSLH